MLLIHAPLVLVDFRHVLLPNAPLFGCFGKLAFHEAVLLFELLDLLLMLRD
jgi:hypothetical protein